MNDLVSLREIYFVRDHDAVKVGVAKNFKSRFIQLQIGNSRVLDLVELWEVERLGIADGFHAEKVLHRLLKPYHIRGEWFRIGVQSLSVIRLYAESILRTATIRNTPIPIPKEPRVKRRVGRPKTIEDMRSYKAQKARDYRLKAKKISLR